MLRLDFLDLEVVLVEEDTSVGHQLEQPLLDDAHVALALRPRVREEEVEVLLAREGRHLHLLLGGEVAQPARALRARLAALDARVDGDVGCLKA